MRSWRKHFDLWIIAALLCGWFAFRHGEEALAFAGPRFVEVKTLVTAKLSEFTAVIPVLTAEDAAVPPDAAATGAIVETPTGEPAGVAPAANQVTETVLSGPSSVSFFSPVCSEPGHICCPR